MKLNMRQIVQIACLVVTVLALTTLGTALTASHYSDQAYNAGQNRHQSYLLADELRQSSDDLTRLARTYVVSGGEERWKQQYFEILDIRNGKKPRPLQYERIYWDFRAADVEVPGAGETVALLDLMKRHGFTDAELGKLAEAKANSDDLVNTETLAMHLVKGLYKDSAGNFTVKGAPDDVRARELMHDTKYHQYKAKIMLPVNEFLKMLDDRTAEALRHARSAQALWSMLADGAVLMLGLVCVCALLLIRAKSRQILLDISTTASRIANGDLTERVPGAVTGEEGRVLGDMQRMQDTLRTLVHDVQRSAMSVSTASAEISQGNQELSDRTERQAAELQQTASTMDQLSTTVRANASHALEASQAAERASSVAAQGGMVVGEMVETIKGIDESSREVLEISALIDGIAFQTNLLALNAAVEAARAGANGRGFAVVAGEVRTLASRSADASREIKALISASVERIKQGTTLADTAGRTMREVVTEIDKVDRLMASIAQASQQQSQGFEHIGAAVSQIDAVTQQNAALVEEAAAASSSLRHQAVSLVGAVERFRTA